MQHLWKLERAYMMDLTSQYPEPRPAYTTIATLLSRMVDKGYVGYVQRGKVREYYPKLKKKTYFKHHLNQLVDHFFNGSTAQFASFFTSKSDLSVKQLEELRQLIDQEIEQRKDDD